MAIQKSKAKKKGICVVTFTIDKDKIGSDHDIRVLGNFNNWNWLEGIKLKESKKAYKAKVELKVGSVYEFRYKANNASWFNDEAADALVASPFYGTDNCLIDLTISEKPKPSKEKTKGKSSQQKKSTKTKSKSSSTTAAKKTTKTKSNTAKASSIKKQLKAKAKESAVTTNKRGRKPKPYTGLGQDYTKIEGIGKVLNDVLHNAGYLTYQDLSKLSPEKISKTLIAANSRYKMYDPTTWPRQAKLAHQDKWSELKEWQDVLSRGKEA